MAGEGYSIKIMFIVLSSNKRSDFSTLKEMYKYNKDFQLYDIFLQLGYKTFSH